MNNLQFDDTESDAMNHYRQVQPPTIAPWFAYLVGSLVAVASIMFVVQVIRVELLIRDVKEGSNKVIESYKDRQKSR